MKMAGNSLSAWPRQFKHGIVVKSDKAGAGRSQGPTGVLPFFYEVNGIGIGGLLEGFKFIFRGYNEIQPKTIQMKHLIRLTSLILFLAAPLCLAEDLLLPSPESPGNIFIRQRAGDFNSFRAAFQNQREDFKANGFSAYSLHRDLTDPQALILTLKCSNLGKGLSFIRSKAYKTAMKKAGVQDSVLWFGVDVTPRQYGELPPKPAGIVIARNQLLSFKYWMAFYNAEHDTQHGGKKPHPSEGYHGGRQYKAGNYSIHRGLGKPDSAIVAHEASDVSKAPAFMNSAPMKTMQKPLGITRFEVWYGYNLEQGFF